VRILIINQEEVADLLRMSECIDVIRSALATLAKGDGIQPLRPVMWLPGGVGALGMMPGYLGDIDTMGIKTVSVFPGNQGTEFDSHQGTVMLFETAHGRPLAIMDATSITEIRTAAVSAVATELLARREVSTLAILGSGVQARSHLEAMREVRPIDTVRVWSRDPDRAARFADRASRLHCITVEPVPTVAAAVTGAAIVCTTTASPEPILSGDLLEPGMHVNAVGSSVAVARELDTDAVARSRLFVDRRESALHEAGDLVIAMRQGAVDENHIVAELGDVIVGTNRGRESDLEITLFKSVGLAVEDVAAARHVYERALATGRGVSVELGGARHEM
jgi:ornithine cyclodeaminase